LEPLRALSSLTWLCLRFWEASDPHLLSFVASLSKLQFLAVHGRPRGSTQLWRNGFALGPHLAGIGTLSELLRLELICVAREDDLSLMTGVCNMPRLAVLVLSHNDELTDWHMAAAPYLNQPSTLRRLHVPYCPRLSDAFLQTLPRNLDYICATHTRLTRRAVSKLRDVRVAL
jgi:hypothetical protein